MSTSNSADPVSAGTEVVAASATESSAQHDTTQTSSEPAYEAKSPKDLEGLKEIAKHSTTSPALANPVASGAPGTENPKPIFQPNWKYKAFGKEKEIDEMWRPLVKDQDSEQKVKDIFTKVDAFDELKNKHDSTSKEFQGLLGEYQALDKDVKKVMSFRNNRDFDNFFQSLRISDQEVFDWVQKKLDLMAQSPEALRVAQAQAQERERVYEMSQEHEALQQNYQTQATQARSMQLDMVLSRPDVSTVASRYDERLGQIGAFRGLVIETALVHHQLSGGRDLSAEEATQVVMQKFGKLLEAPQAPATQAQTFAPQPQVEKKPVIPVVNGRGTSPVKKAPKSLDDLKAMYKEMTAGG